MSISSDIIRIKGAKTDLETAIESKGVTVPPGTLIDAYPALVDAIPGDATAVAADIRASKTAYAGGAKLTGTLTVDTLVDNAVVITAVDGNGRIMAVDHYGAAVLPNEFGAYSANASNAYSFMQTCVLKNAITAIGENAFAKCTSLSGLTVPEPCVAVGAYAFNDCASLSAIVLRRVAVILTNTFRNCTSLTSVTFGSIGYAITSITATAFANCTQLGLTITVYVTPGTQPLANSPWGATNATIVYRSAVDGSVL